MYKDLITEENLTCTEEEFTSYVNSIDTTALQEELEAVEVSKFTFDELYN
jgi:hypothetical protein